MVNRNRGLVADTLFVGVTRPTMRWGVTFASLMINMVFTMELFVMSRNLLTLLLAFPIHGVSMLLCARDARFFDLMALWGMTRLPAAMGNLWHWRANSYSPLVLAIPSVTGRRRGASDVYIGTLSHREVFRRAREGWVCRR